MDAYFFFGGNIQWMPVDELRRQPFYQDDQMSGQVIEVCMAAYEAHYTGFVGRELHSKMDKKLSCLYYPIPHCV